MNPHMMLAFQDELEKIAQSRQEALWQKMHPEMAMAFEDELRKTAVVSRTIRRLASGGSAGQKFVQSVGSTPTGAGTLLRARNTPGSRPLTKAEINTNKTLVSAALPGAKKRKPLREDDLSLVVSDGVRIPKSAFESMSLKEAKRFALENFGHTGPLGLGRSPLRRANVATVQRAADTAESAAINLSANPAVQRIIGSASTGQIADLGDAAATVGTEAVPAVMRAVSKMKTPRVPRPPRGLPRPTTPPTPQF